MTSSLSGPKAAPRARIPPAVGIVLCLALSVVSIVLCLAPEAPPLEVDEALAAVEQARGGAGAPALLVDPRREEIVWYAGGLMRLQAPWSPPPGGAWVAVAHDPGALPSGQGEGEEGPLVVVGSWAARGFGIAPGAGVELLNMLDRLEVGVLERSSGAERRCGVFQQGRWFCGPQGWNFVGPQELVFEGVKERCLWLHPHESGELRVRLSGVAPGSRLSGRYGFSDDAAATADGAPVMLTVALDGEPLLERSHPNRRGLVPFSVAVPGDGAERTLELRVDAAKTGRRYFCLQAQLFSPEVAP